MDTKFWISGVVMSVLAFALGFVVHGLLLAGDYTPLAGSVFRTPEDAHSHLLYMVLAYILFGFAFTWIYRHAGASTLGQGVRFWLAINAHDDPNLPHLLHSAALIWRARREADRIRRYRRRAHGYCGRLSKPIAGEA